MEESAYATSVHAVNKDHAVCNDRDNPSNSKNDCDLLKNADPWYYLLLFTTDIVLVLCSFVMLLLFADWILFVAPVRVTSVF